MASAHPPTNRKCQLMLGDRICDEPATHVYHGIGGAQDMCDEHTLSLRRAWGIRPTPIAEIGDLSNHPETT